MQPCLIFAGESFEFNPEHKQAKSLLLDLFRGRLVEGLNLMVPFSHPYLITSHSLFDIVYQSLETLDSPTRLQLSLAL